jgi:hypothetical protein
LRPEHFKAQQMTSDRPNAPTWPKPARACSVTAESTRPTACADSWFEASHPSVIVLERLAFFGRFSAIATAIISFLAFIGRFFCEFILESCSFCCKHMLDSLDFAIMVGLKACIFKGHGDHAINAPLSLRWTGSFPQNFGALFLGLMFMAVPMNVVAFSQNCSSSVQFPLNVILCSQKCLEAALSPIDGQHFTKPSSSIIVTCDSTYYRTGNTCGHPVCCVEFPSGIFVQLKNRQTMPVFKSAACVTMKINDSAMLQRATFASYCTIFSGELSGCVQCSNTGSPKFRTCRHPANGFKRFYGCIVIHIVLTEAVDDDLPVMSVLDNALNISSEYDLSSMCTAMPTMNLPVCTLQPAERQMLMLTTCEECISYALFSMLYEAFTSTSQSNSLPKYTKPASSPVHVIQPAKRQISMLKTAEGTITDSVHVLDNGARRSELLINRQNVDFKSMHLAFFVWFSLAYAARLAKNAEVWKRDSLLQRTVIKYVHIFHHNDFIVRLNFVLVIQFLINSIRKCQILALRRFFSSVLAPCPWKLENMQNWMASAVLVVIVFTAPVIVQGIPYVGIPQTRYDLLQSVYYLNRSIILALFWMEVP